jgi:hypothetical protein
VCGSVPSHLFTITDDFRPKAEKEQKARDQKVLPTTPNTPLTPESDKEPGSASIIMGTLVSKTSVTSFNKTTYIFNVRVITKSGAKTISRTYADVLQFHAEMTEELAGNSILAKLPLLPEQDVDIKELYRAVYNYISSLFQCASRKALDSKASEKFFNSGSQAEKYEDPSVRSKASMKLFNILGKYI